MTLALGWGIGPGNLGSAGQDCVQHMAPRHACCKHECRPTRLRTRRWYPPGELPSAVTNTASQWVLEPPTVHDPCRAAGRVGQYVWLRGVPRWRNAMPTNCMKCNTLPETPSVEHLRRVHLYLPFLLVTNPPTPTAVLSIDVLDISGTAENDASFAHHMQAGRNAHLPHRAWTDSRGWSGRGHPRHMQAGRKPQPPCRATHERVRQAWHRRGPAGRAAGGRKGDGDVPLQLQSHGSRLCGCLRSACRQPRGAGAVGHTAPM